MKKLMIVMVVVLLSLTGCGKKDAAVVKVGLNGTDSVVWKEVQKLAKAKGIALELVFFNDYVQPNIALQEGEIDLNAFQTVAFLEEAIKKNNWEIVPIATTLKAPMGIYSTKHQDIKQIKNGAKFAIPNEGSNKNRAIELVANAQLISLKDGYDPANITNADIISNPYNIAFVELMPNQIPRSLPDVDYGVINSGIAVDAGYIPATNAVFLEPDTTTKYINVIASKKEQKDLPIFQKIISIYQSEVIGKLIASDSKNSQIPTFVPLATIGW